MRRLGLPELAVATITLAAIALAVAGCSSSTKPTGKASSRTTSAATTSTSGTRQSSGSTTTAAPSTPSCDQAPVSEVGQALGLHLQSPSSQVTGTVTVCTYSGSPGPVTIRFQSGESSSTFEAAEQSFQQHGEPTTDVPGLGDAAYSSTVGSGQFQDNTIVVLKGSVELLITAPVVLDDINALARQILPSI
ncbi:MAG: hypothetical protein ABSC00_07210 [Acidimicrobiales bacterium]|jgi:hypothetical protein